MEIVPQARHATDGGEIEISFPDLPLIEAGEYQLAFVSHRTLMLFGKAPKVALRFRVVTLGKAHGVMLDRFYNVQKIIGAPRKGGGFQPSRHGDFLTEYMSLFPLRVKRLDRLTLAPFRNVVITGKVGTVTNNAKQKALPEPLQYSVIQELIKTGA
jgi:hypothetical protein